MIDRRNGPWLPAKGGRGHLRRYPAGFEAMCLELNARCLMVYYRCGRGTIERWMEMLPVNVVDMWLAQNGQRMRPIQRTFAARWL